MEELAEDWEFGTTLEVYLSNPLLKLFTKEGSSMEDGTKSFHFKHVAIGAFCERRMYFFGVQQIFMISN